MRKTIGMFSRKIVNRAVLAGIAFSGFSFAGNAYAELAISKQLTTPMTKIEGNKYRVDFSLRVLNTDEAEISNIEVRDTVKTDFESVTGVSVSKHAGVDPSFVIVKDASGAPLSVSEGTLAPGFLDSDTGTILTGGVLKKDEFLIIRYALNVDFGNNTDPISTSSTVRDDSGERDISNNGELPENHTDYNDDATQKDSPTTIYFPKYDNAAYEKDSVCKVALGDTAFESSYELIKNGGFFTKPRSLAVDEKFIASNTLLADSFTSGAQYAGNNAFPSHETDDDGRTGAQISIRNDVALHNNSAQQYSFPGDPDRPFVEQTNSWLFSHGNKTGAEVDVWKQDVELVEDKIYNFSMYVSNGAWPDPGFSGEEHPEIQVLVDGSPVEITLNNGSKSSEPVELPADDDSDDWKLVQGTFIAPKAGATTIKIRNSQNGHNYNYLAIMGIGLHRCALPEVDSDGDSISDEDENTAGSNPDSPTDNSVSDVDGDGIADHLDANDNDGKLADIDNDGLTNEEEEKLGTDPNKSDTDGDGKDDKTEVGDDVNNPLDSDNDCKIDALESSAVDSDGDGQMDEKDAQPTSCTGGGGGGTTSLGLLAIMTLPIILRRRRKDG